MLIRMKLMTTIIVSLVNVRQYKDMSAIAIIIRSSPSWARTIISTSHYHHHHRCQQVIRMQPTITFTIANSITYYHYRQPRRHQSLSSSSPFLWLCSRSGFASSALSRGLGRQSLPLRFDFDYDNYNYDDGEDDNKTKEKRKGQGRSVGKRFDKYQKKKQERERAIVFQIIMIWFW